MAHITFEQFLNHTNAEEIIVKKMREAGPRIYQLNYDRRLKHCKVLYKKFYDVKLRDSVFGYGLVLKPMPNCFKAEFLQFPRTNNNEGEYNSSDTAENKSPQKMKNKSPPLEEKYKNDLPSTSSAFVYKPRFIPPSGKNKMQTKNKLKSKSQQQPNSKPNYKIHTSTKPAPERRISLEKQKSSKKSPKITNYFTSNSLNINVDEQNFEQMQLRKRISDPLNENVKIEPETKRQKISPVKKIDAKREPKVVISEIGSLSSKKNPKFRDKIKKENKCGGKKSGVNKSETKIRTRLNSDDIVSDDCDINTNDSIVNLTSENSRKNTPQASSDRNLKKNYSSPTKSVLPKRNRTEDYGKTSNTIGKNLIEEIIPEQLKKPKNGFTKHEIELWITEGQKALEGNGGNIKKSCTGASPNHRITIREDVSVGNKLRTIKMHPEKVKKYIKYWLKFELQMRKGTNLEATVACETSRAKILTAFNQMTYEDFKNLINDQSYISHWTSLGKSIAELEENFKNHYTAFIRKEKSWPAVHIKLTKLQSFLHSKGIKGSIPLKNIPPRVLSFDEVLEKTNIKECISLNCSKPPESYKELLSLCKKEYEKCCCEGVWAEELKFNDKQEESGSSQEMSIELFTEPSSSMSPLKITLDSENIQKKVAQKELPGLQNLDNNNRSYNVTKEFQSNDQNELEKNSSQSAFKQRRSRKCGPKSRLKHSSRSDDDLEIQIINICGDNEEPLSKNTIDPMVPIDTQELNRILAHSQTQPLPDKEKNVSDSRRRNSADDVVCADSITNSLEIVIENNQKIVIEKSHGRKSSPKSRKKYSSGSDDDLEIRINQICGDDELPVLMDSIKAMKQLETQELNRILAHSQSEPLPDKEKNVSDSKRRNSADNVVCIDSITQSQLKHSSRSDDDLEIRIHQICGSDEQSMLKNSSKPMIPIDTQELNRILAHSQSQPLSDNGKDITHSHRKNSADIEGYTCSFEKDVENNQIDVSEHANESPIKTKETPKIDNHIALSPNIFAYSDETNIQCSDIQMSNKTSKRITNIESKEKHLQSFEIDGFISTSKDKSNDKHPKLREKNNLIPPSPNLFQSSGDSYTKSVDSHLIEVQTQETVYVPCEENNDFDTEQNNFSISINEESEGEDPFGATIANQEETVVIRLDPDSFGELNISEESTSVNSTGGNYEAENNDKSNKNPEIAFGELNIPEGSTSSLAENLVANKIMLNTIDAEEPIVPKQLSLSYKENSTKSLETSVELNVSEKLTSCAGINEISSTSQNIIESEETIVLKQLLLSCQTVSADCLEATNIHKQNKELCSTEPSSNRSYQTSDIVVVKNTNLDSIPYNSISALNVAEIAYNKEKESKAKSIGPDINYVGESLAKTVENRNRQLPKENVQFIQPERTPSVNSNSLCSHNPAENEKYLNTDEPLTTAKQTLDHNPISNKDTNSEMELNASISAESLRDVKVVVKRENFSQSFSQYDDDVEIIEIPQSDAMVIDDEETAPELLEALLCSSPRTKNASRTNLYTSLSPVTSSSIYLDNFPQAQQLPSNFDLTQSQSNSNQSNNELTNASSVKAYFPNVNDCTPGTTMNTSDNVSDSSDCHKFKTPHIQVANQSCFVGLKKNSSSYEATECESRKKTSYHKQKLIYNKPSNSKDDIQLSEEMSEVSYVSIAPQNIPSEIEFTQTGLNKLENQKQKECLKLMSSSDESAKDMEKTNKACIQSRINTISTNSGDNTQESGVSTLVCVRDNFGKTNTTSINLELLKNIKSKECLKSNKISDLSTRKQSEGMETFKNSGNKLGDEDVENKEGSKTQPVSGLAEHLLDRSSDVEFLEESTEEEVVISRNNLVEDDKEYGNSKNSEVIDVKVTKDKRISIESKNNLVETSESGGVILNHPNEGFNNIELLENHNKDNNAENLNISVEVVLSVNDSDDVELVEESNKDDDDASNAASLSKPTSAINNPRKYITKSKKTQNTKVTEKNSLSQKTTVRNDSDDVKLLKESEEDDNDAVDNIAFLSGSRETHTNVPKCHVLLKDINTFNVNDVDAKTTCREQEKKLDHSEHIIGSVKSIRACKVRIPKLNTLQAEQNLNKIIHLPVKEPQTNLKEPIEAAKCQLANDYEGVLQKNKEESPTKQEKECDNTKNQPYINQKDVLDTLTVEHCKSSETHEDLPPRSPISGSLKTNVPEVSKLIVETTLTTTNVQANDKSENNYSSVREKPKDAINEYVIPASSESLPGSSQPTNKLKDTLENVDQHALRASNKITPVPSQIIKKAKNTIEVESYSQSFGRIDNVNDKAITTSTQAEHPVSIQNDSEEQNSIAAETSCCSSVEFIDFSFYYISSDDDNCNQNDDSQKEEKFSHSTNFTELSISKKNIADASKAINFPSNEGLFETSNEGSKRVFAVNIPPTIQKRSTEISQYSKALDPSRIHNRNEIENFPNKSLIIAPVVSTNTDVNFNLNISYDSAVLNQFKTTSSEITLLKPIFQHMNAKGALCENQHSTVELTDNKKTRRKLSKDCYPVNKDENDKEDIFKIIQPVNSREQSNQLSKSLKSQDIEENITVSLNIGPVLSEDNTPTAISNHSIDEKSSNENQARSSLVINQCNFNKHSKNIKKAVGEVIKMKIKNDLKRDVREKTVLGQQKSVNDSTMPFSSKPLSEINNFVVTQTCPKSDSQRLFPEISNEITEVPKNNFEPTKIQKTITLQGFIPMFSLQNIQPCKEDFVEVPIMVEKRLFDIFQPMAAISNSIRNNPTQKTHPVKINVQIKIDEQQLVFIEDQTPLSRQELRSPTIPLCPCEEARISEKEVRAQENAEHNNPVIKPPIRLGYKAKTKTKIPQPSISKKKTTPKKSSKLPDFVQQKTHAFSSIPLKPCSKPHKSIPPSLLTVEECDYLIEDVSQTNATTNASQILGTDCTYFENSELLRNVDNICIPHHPEILEVPTEQLPAEVPSSLPTTSKVISLIPITLSEGVTARKVWQVNLQWKSQKAMSLEVRFSVNRRTMTVCDESAKLLFTFTPGIWSDIHRILREIDHFEYKRRVFKNQRKTTSLHKVLRHLFDSSTQVVDVKLINDSYNPYTICEKTIPMYRKPFQCLSKGIAPDILNKMKFLKENLLNNNNEVN